MIISFNKIVQGTKRALEQIVAEMKEEKNPNLEATESSVKTLVENKLDKIIGGAKTASGELEMLVN
ncbi:hypothetical protein Q7M_1422 (plasmid) [Borrelia crocidurae str. Achema]|uniref:Variable large protein n=1 Tax=Borrelia crocidurae (strain Achema) TaxID=1155096 RepID=I0FFJ2_BORCA|nr:hypothetical protein Q7M_1422 [Borrelia crocidurae str. Achema]